MENELIRIPKLKGIENWAVWKFQTRVILQSSDAWSIVGGSSAIPVQGQTIDETTFNRTLAAWKKNDSIAQRIIATTVEEKPLLHILNCKSAKDMWDKLIQVYEQKSETSIHMLMQQWYNLQMKSDDDIAIYVARLEDLAHRLEIMGEKIPDQMLITKLLMTLPPTYKVPATTVKNPGIAFEIARKGKQPTRGKQQHIMTVGMKHSSGKPSQPCRTVRNHQKFGIWTPERQIICQINADGSRISSITKNQNLSELQSCNRIWKY
ncbi:hypothetical protein GEV33_002473 [Tenebrio molitor]|uniref:Copia protein n=1 Tax=Tenebrio molitor TaxID=7067 RepID=A0A8J6HU99_TENMO|nr:hypothetical protein GEV33_002473 [Tenebrio molitor]